MLVLLIGILLVVFAPSSKAVCSSNASYSVETKLMKCLRDSMTRTLPPLTFDEKGIRIPTTIAVRYAYFSIYDLIDKENLLTGSAWIKLDWQDNRLRWDPSKYNDVKQILIPASSMWTPEPSFFFSGVSSGSSIVKTKGINTLRAKVWYNGTVEWTLIIEYTGTCMVDYTNFPEDQQNCLIGVFFYPEDVKQLSYNVEHNFWAFSDSAEWRVVDEDVYDVVTGITDREHFRLTFSITLARRSNFYRYTLILPLTLIGILGLLMFWIPVENNQRFVYAISLLMSMLSLLITFQNNMPTGVKKLPIFLKCLILEVVFLAVSIVISIFTYLAYYHDPRNQLPPIVKKILLNPIVKKLTFVGGTEPQQLSTNVENNFSATATQPKPLSSTIDQTLLSLYQYFSAMKDEKFQHQSVLVSNSEWKQVALVTERISFYCTLLAYVIVIISAPIQMAEHPLDLGGDY